MRNILILLGFFACTVMFGQDRYLDERTVYTMDHIYPALSNVGAYGHKGDHELILNYRNTWSSFEGSPKTITLQYNGEVFDKLGAGVTFFNDTYGALQTTKFGVGANYSIVSATNKLSFGLSGDYVKHSLRDIEGLDAEDVVVAARLDGSTFVDLGVGIYGTYMDKMIYGLSLPSLVSSRISGEEVAEVEKNLGYIIQLGYVLNLPEYTMKVTPMVTHKDLMFAPSSTRLDVLATFLGERLTGGVSYTINGENTIGFLLGTKVSNFNLYYGYQVSNHAFQTHNNGSHDLTLSYRM